MVFCARTPAGRKEGEARTGATRRQEQRGQERGHRSRTGLCAEQSAKPRAKKQGYKSLAAPSPLLLSKGRLLMYESTQAGNFLVVTVKFLCSCSTQGYAGH